MVFHPRLCLPVSQPSVAVGLDQLAISGCSRRSLAAPNRAVDNAVGRRNDQYRRHYQQDSQSVKSIVRQKEGKGLGRVFVRTC